MKKVLFQYKTLVAIIFLCMISPAFAARKLNIPKAEFKTAPARETQEVRAENDPKQAYFLACAWIAEKVFNERTQTVKESRNYYSGRYRYTTERPYENYIGTLERPKRIKTLLKSASDGGIPDASYLLAQMYEKEGDMERAISLYKKAADRELVEAQCRMGCFYKTGVASSGIEGAVGDSTDLVPKNEALALSMFAAAAKMNIPEANYQIGLCFEAGVGVPRNKKKAIEFYTKAKKQRHPEAQLALERCQE